MQTKGYALITGASQGIGRSIAFGLARRGYPLLLVSRTAGALQALAQELQQAHALQVHYLACDLSAPGAAGQVNDWCLENGYPVQILVNNAGYGLFGRFDSALPADTSNMMQLNMLAVVELTRLLLPLLKAQPQAYILNLASTAAYQAMPGMAVYAACKSFILSFSRALRSELKGRVSVTCLCPGPTATGFAARSGLGSFAQLSAKFDASAGAVAEKGLKALFAQRAEAVPGFRNSLGAFANRLLPKSMVESLITRIFPLPHE